MRFQDLLLILCTACNGAESAPGTTVQMSFDRAQGFYAAPFPSDDLAVAGHVDLSRFPNPGFIGIVTQARDLLMRDADGFALSGGVFFQLSGAVDPARLPDAAASLGADAPVFLVGVSAGPDHLRRQPVDVTFAVDGGPFGAPNLLALLPVQGVPLRPRTTYAAVVLRKLGDATGQPLGVGEPMAALAAGARPPGLPEAAFARYGQAMAALRSAGVDPHDVAGLAVFTTGDPTAGLGRFRDDVLALPPPAPGPWQRTKARTSPAERSAWAPRGHSSRGWRAPGRPMILRRPPVRPGPGACFARLSEDEKS